MNCGLYVRIFMVFGHFSYFRVPFRPPPFPRPSRSPVRNFSDSVPDAGAAEQNPQVKGPEHKERSVRDGKVRERPGL